MQTVSAAFLKEITRDHKYVSYLEVASPTGASPFQWGQADWSTPIRLMVTSGAVTVDRTAAVRRRLTATVIDPTGRITPLNAKSILSPFGAVVTAWRGVEYTSGALSGSIEVVPLGTFRISQTIVKRVASGGQSISIDCYDLSRTMDRDAFTIPYTVPTGDNVLQAVQDLVTRSFPDAEFDATSTHMALPTPLVFVAQDKPFTVANTQLAADAGCELYVTADNKWKVAVPPDIDNLPAPVFTYIEGPGCTLVEADLQLSDEPGYNGVILTAGAVSSTTPPIMSIVWDTEPTSPTYYLGPYGDVPYFMNSTTITTQADADTAARAQLSTFLGVQSTLSVTALTNPALDADDTIEVVTEALGVSQKYSVDAVTIPLDNTTQQLTLRQKRTV